MLRRRTVVTGVFGRPSGFTVEQFGHDGPRLHRARRMQIGGTSELSARGIGEVEELGTDDAAIPDIARQSRRLVLPALRGLLGMREIELPAA